MDALRPLGESRFAFADPYQDVRGWVVRDSAGKDLGHLEDVLIDESAHQVRFLKIAHGRVFGFVTTHSLIPIEAVTSVADDQITVETSAEKVAGAPRYQPDLVEPRFEHQLVDKNHHYEDLYGYYGYQAPWAAMPVARLPRRTRP
jgi:sporulation protein YlmC with PRC-barrel domain